jgi:hypothetical protein
MLIILKNPSIVVHEVALGLEIHQLWVGEVGEISTACAVIILPATKQRGGPPQGAYVLEQYMRWEV